MLQGRFGRRRSRFTPLLPSKSADERAYIARTHFVFADGSQGCGYCSPTEDSGLDYIQPVVITPAGRHMRFWREQSVDAAEPYQRDEEHRILFPVRFECVVPFQGQQLCGTITGFTTANA